MRYQNISASYRAARGLSEIINIDENNALIILPWDSYCSKHFLLKEAK